MTIIKIYAKPISYEEGKRDKAKTVKYIVVHNTGNVGDTAVNNGMYFKNGNKAKAGAHFFIDRKGEIVKSIPMERVARAVGGKKYANTKGAKYYNKCTNDNSVSIELCDIIDKDPSETQLKSLKALIKYIRKYCPKANTVIRHYDVNGKPCPKRYTDEEKWCELKKKIGE